MPRYARILPDPAWWQTRHDVEVSVSRHQDPSFAANFNSDKPYPGVIELYRTAQGGDTSWRINQAWWDYHRAINSTTAWWALRRNNAGWINWAQNKEWGQGGGAICQP